MFEKIQLLHRLYPVYLLGARMVAWMSFEDTDAHNFVMLQHLHWKVDRLRERLETIASAPRPSGAAAAAMPALPPLGADGLITLDHWNELGKAAGAAQQQQQQQEQPAGGPALPPNPALPGNGLPAAPPEQAPASGGGRGGRNIMSLVYFFGVYFFFQWLLGRGS